jgi:hypothetical protein
MRIEHHLSISFLSIKFFICFDVIISFLTMLVLIETEIKVNVNPSKDEVFKSKTNFIIATKIVFFALYLCKTMFGVRAWLKEF